MSIENRIKEKLSNHFVGIIAHSKGYKVSVTEDDDGIDYKISGVEEIVIGSSKYIHDTEKSIDVQLKSTTEDKVSIQSNELIYYLRVSNYNKLVTAKKTRKFIPYILILFILPKNKAKWVDLKINQLNLKKHCYWFVPSDDMQLETIKDKNSKIKIKIPLANKLNINSFDYFFENLIPE